MGCFINASIKSFQQNIKEQQGTILKKRQQKVDKIKNYGISIIDLMKISNIVLEKKTYFCCVLLCFVSGLYTFN